MAGSKKKRDVALTKSDYRDARKGAFREYRKRFGESAQKDDLKINNSLISALVQKHLAKKKAERRPKRKPSAKQKRYYAAMKKAAAAYRERTGKKVNLRDLKNKNSELYKLLVHFYPSLDRAEHPTRWLRGSDKVKPPLRKNKSKSHRKKGASGEKEKKKKNHSKSGDKKKHEKSKSSGKKKKSEHAPLRRSVRLADLR